ncbi:MAG: hypothetical protein GTO51_04275 [Candidatus Latescibacteria bacterium]|nr:hypothetical protein [Candidatus Latescibacterota bacterium]NIM21057.1 hypothetical protein [Candidatus Latescibacterota bacterium]NIM65192.1 hypothetical protein [Candidatus Latescibacterota bacterium]NIO01707.1 hypothetical protein [Candidatus Latescibacterota bacterium]NIO28224.1 hypothetical protein [Candidatus Latescibacterota bacterium]
MVVFNYSGEEINAKVVYYGPGLSGKTTNLEYIYSKMPDQVKGKMVSMKTRTDRTLFFDFLPLELGDISGFRTRFLLYTVPGQVYYNATRKLVLKGADAVVFVADSSRAKMNENIESLRNLEENLNEHGLTLDTIPWVIQYNKRDLEDAMPLSELDQHLNLLHVPAYEAVATNGTGIYETFQGIARLLYNELKKRLEEEARRVERKGKAQGVPRVAVESQSLETIKDQKATDSPQQKGAQPAQEPSSPSETAATTPKPASASRSGKRGAVSDAIDLALRELDVPARTTQATAEPSDSPQADTSRRAPGNEAKQTPPPQMDPVEVDAKSVPSPQKGTPASPPVPGSPSEHEQGSGETTTEEIPVFPQQEPAERPKSILERITQAVSRVQKSESDEDESELAPMDDMDMENRLGRVVELDEAPETEEGGETEAAEFITDPCRAKVGDDQTAQAPTSDQHDQVTMDSVQVHSKTPDDLTFTVPVVISRSQVRRTIPLKLVLEIHVTDDESKT